MNPFGEYYVLCACFCYVVAIVIAIWVVLIPHTIAVKRGSPRATAIGLLGFFGSLLWGIGWVAACIWAFCEPIKSTPPKSWRHTMWMFLPLWLGIPLVAVGH
jgi:hypothetical protein